MIVTPEQAGAWLAHPNLASRPIDPDAVARWVAAMDAGIWDSGPARDPIVIIGTGVEDGRHRLSAVVAHGRPVAMRVEFGWDWATGQI